MIIPIYLRIRWDYTGICLNENESMKMLKALKPWTSSLSNSLVNGSVMSMIETNNL